MRRPTLTVMTEVPSPRELDITLERNSAVPLYFQLARSIERAITSGELAAGDRLENEVSMTRRLGLSRPTARQAIQELVNKGLLVRKRGVGTQVIHSQFSREERLTSLYDDLEQAGKVPSTRLLAYRIGGLDDESRRAIDLSDAAPAEFLTIRRLRLADDMPLAILTNHLPARFQLSEQDLESQGLYAGLRAAGVNLKIAHQRIGARLMTAEEASLLAETVPAACLTVERIAYDDTGQLVDYGRHVYRATHYSVQSSLVV
jgi:GntR family transcriptional regulator